MTTVFVQGGNVLDVETLIFSQTSVLVREEIQKGATQIKIMASGGALYISSFYPCNTNLVVFVPLTPALAPRNQVIQVGFPCCNGLGRHPVGNGDAKVTGIARTFNTQIF